MYFTNFLLPFFYGFRGNLNPGFADVMKSDGVPRPDIGVLDRPVCLRPRG
jgi:hypothetical protein